MREYSNPSLAGSEKIPGVLHDVLRAAHEAPGAVGFASAHSFNGSGLSPARWEDVTYSEFAHDVSVALSRLRDYDVVRGQSVLVIAQTSYAWTVCDYALMALGAVSVPVYPTSSPAQIEAIGRDCGATTAVLDESARGDGLWACGADTARACIDIEALVPSPLARRQAPRDEAEWRQFTEAVGELDLAGVATILYTSGTTGQARGCPITHEQLTFESEAVASMLHELFDQEQASTLLALPLAHVFARLVQLTAVRTRVKLGYSRGVSSLVADVGTFKPSFLLGVPRIFEKIFTQLSQQATVDGRGRAFARATRAAIDYSRALDADDKPSLRLRARYAEAQRRTLPEFQSALGGRCKFAICGGAPLGDRLGHFYRGAGIPILEGYGLTETTGAACVSTPENVKVGYVGRPLPGTTVRISDEGELLIHGPHIFGGYLNDPDASYEVLSAAGWLQTGDLGEIDSEGMVRITGRRKELLITAGGKNVAPAALEDVLRGHPLIDQALVVGDGRPFVAALITLDPIAVQERQARGKGSDGFRKSAKLPDVEAEVALAIERANESVSQAESIRAFRILPHQWSEEGGELTASLKLRRHRLLSDYAEVIDALYG